MRALPDGWLVRPFSEIADYKIGRTPARANAAYWRGDSSVPWVSISDMEPYGTLVKTRECITPIALDQVFQGNLVSAGTLLMSFKLTIGRVATLGVDACHNEAIIAIYPRADVDQRYLGYFLSQVRYELHQDRQIKGHTLNRDKIDRIPIVLPPIEEQRAIADLLDLIRDARRVNELQMTNAERLKHAAASSLFKRGLRNEPQRETALGPVPESWGVSSIGDHFGVVSGGTPSRANREYWYAGTIPWVKTTEVNYGVIRSVEEHITELGLQKSAAKILPAGTLLMAMYGQGVTRGKVAILGLDAAFNQACAAMRPSDDVVDPNYLFHFLSYRYEEIRRLAHGGQQQNLNLDIVRDLQIAFPEDPSEQRQIVKILDAIDLKLDLHARKGILLDDLFAVSLDSLMAGETNVRGLSAIAFETAPVMKEAFA
jgi:type I restriction enzyme S subunit